MSQKRRMSKRRRKALMKRRILIAAMAVILLAFIGGTVFLISHIKKSNTKQATTKETTTKEAVSADVDVLNLTTDETDQTKDDTADKDDAKKKTEGEAPDRSSFAVDPAVPVGSDTSTEEKVVYLTFDDGPSYNTQAVLDILDKYNAKATFFVVGVNPEYANLIKVAYDKGHTIGLHTCSHDYAQVYSSVDAYFSDLDAIGQIVKQQIGYVPCFIRFPGGSSNTISADYTSGIMTILAQEVQARGYQYYDWNISSGDGAVKTKDELIAQATTGDAYTNIVLLSHDSNNKETTVEALPAIIEHYQALGYEFKAIDRNTFDAHHGIGN